MDAVVLLTNEFGCKHTDIVKLVSGLESCLNLEFSGF